MTAALWLRLNHSSFEALRGRSTASGAGRDLARRDRLKHARFAYGRALAHVALGLIQEYRECGMCNPNIHIA